MKKLIVSVVFMIGLSAAAQADSFKLTSAGIKPGSKIGMDQVFNSFGCTGKNISPQLKWTGAPKETKAFALMMYDPDAPTGSGWWHWVAFNIPASTTELAAGASGSQMPAGAIEGRTDFGKPGYGGPCPPPGDKPHRYIFTVFALKDNLPLQADTPAAQVGYYANQNKLATAKLEAKFGR